MENTFREITIPGDVLNDETISDGAKIVYGKIARLSFKNGFCWASNSFLDGTKSGRSASRFIKELETAGFIVIINQKGKGRKICVCPLNSKVNQAEFDINNDSEPRQIGKDNDDQPRQIGKDNDDQPRQILHEPRQILHEPRQILHEPRQIGDRTINNNINNNYKEHIPIQNKKPANNGFAILDREPKNDIERINKQWLLNYQELYNTLPVNPKWQISTQRITAALKQTDVDMLLSALNYAKKDKFCKDANYSLQVIFSSNVISRLINELSVSSQKKENSCVIDRTPKHDKTLREMQTEILETGQCAELDPEAVADMLDRIRQWERENLSPEEVEAREEKRRQWRKEHEAA